MAANFGLGLLFTARDLASQTVRQLDKNVKELDGTIDEAGASMNNSLKQLGVGMGLAAAGVKGFSAAISLAGKAGEFEQGIAAVGAISSATADDMLLLESAATKAGIATQFSPTEAAKGLQSLAAAGQGAKESTETLIPVLDLAAASLGQLGVAESAEAVVGTLKAYGLEAGRAGDITDRLVKITSISNFQARDFATGLSKAAAAGSAFGQDINTVLISMGLLRNANIDASSSATAFREATRRLGADEKVQKELRKAGVEVFDKQTGKMRDIVEVIQELGAKTKDLTDQERNALVSRSLGVRGLLLFNAVNKATGTVMKDGVKVTLTGAAAIANMRLQMTKTSGAAAEFTERLLDTFEGQKTLLKGTLETLAIALGKPFAEIFKPIVRAVTNGLNFFIQAFQELPAPVQKAIAVLFLATSAMAALGGAILIAKVASKGFGLSMGFIRTAVAGAFAPILPFIPILLAIGLAFFLLKKAFDENIGGFRDDMISIWENDLAPVIEELGTAFREVFNALMTAIRPLFPVFAQLVKVFAKIIAALAPILAVIIKVFIKTLVPVLKVIAFIIKNVVVPMIEFMVDVFQAWADFAIPIFQAVAEFLIDNLGPAFTTLGEVAVAIAGFIIKAWEFVKPAIEPIVDFLIDAVGVLADVIDKIKDAINFLGDVGEGIGGFAFDVFGDEGGVATAGSIAEGRARLLGSSPVSPTQFDALPATAAQRGPSQQTINLQGGKTELTSNITVELDGETVANSVVKQNADDADRRSQVVAGGID